MAVAALTGSYYGRDQTDRNLKNLAALPTPDAHDQKVALIKRLEDDARDDRYSTLTSLVTRSESPMFEELGFRALPPSETEVGDEDFWLVSKVLQKDNIISVRFGRNQASQQ